MKKLTDNVMLLGNGYFNYYIVGQKEAALVECGTTAGAAILAQQWAELEEQPDIKYLIALHSHFDHACGIPALKRMFPEALVVASKTGQKLLGKDRIVKGLFDYDKVVSDNYLKNGLLDKEPEPPGVDIITVDIAVGDGDQIELGDGLRLDIIDTPGHSICSISAYLAKDQVMFISDAAGIQGADKEISPVFFQDYDLTVGTIKRLMSYPTRVIGVAHGDTLVGGEVEAFYQESLAAAVRCFDLIKDQLAQGMEEKVIAAELYDMFIKDGLLFYPVDMMTGAMSLLIESVKRKL
ncbi:hypothetical protein ASZ90_020179 [hydrocarbon metagenome]|uniref:Metallo-beta-lactamase domain-containing protein n=1 Tax=hydrocarbon metagenome TaxID=938273 RepID=A0A0W8E1E0_9ZZZZ